MSNKRPVVNNHPLVKLVYSQLDDQNISYNKMAKLSGVDVSTFSNWKFKCSPTLINIEAVLNALGYDLKAVKRCGKSSTR